MGVSHDHFLIGFSLNRIVTRKTVVDMHSYRADRSDFVKLGGGASDGTVSGLS